MNGTETLGHMAGALAAARTVEPTAGDHRADGHTHESACLNCATPLVGSHCHACGQAAHVHKTLGAFFHDLLHGVFHFEGKIWRTLPLLVTKPGKLTREYIDGRRASYVSPIALFLFCVFALFTTINSLGGDIGASVNTTVEQGLKQERNDLAVLEAERIAARGDAAELAKIDAAIAETRKNIAGLEQVKASGINVGNIDTSGLETASDIGWIKEAVKKAKANPSLALYKVQNYSYKLSWALIPISVPFLWLLFPFSRRFGLYDHTVFVTYSLCFMTLLGIVATVGGRLALPGLPALAFLPPLHMLLQLRGAYGLSWFGAWWRTWFLSLFAFVAMMLFAVVILVEAGG
ncbi:DUF3667 domain-containing protein [Novosphingobium sp. ES2-1]|uniref:DUF3667 domain-containing protein n=1 Tax=Novosphingobium sp. ES2-1 TaxID=2780074 RepID=UPI001E6223F1|nr:DUF3667 domain-containing protein [Novosphingobium sp. ES2-1]